MQKILWGLSVVIMAMAGCGGGGGAADQSALRLSDDIVGTWQVADLGLPNDQIVIENDGDVAVEVTTSQTRSDSPGALIVIGSCSSGELNLNGSWTVNGVERSIVATGNVDSTGSALSLSATVSQDEEIVCRNVTVTGVKDDGLSDLSSDDIEPPPAPPF
jgi:hypothetical protein